MRSTVNCLPFEPSVCARQVPQIKLPRTASAAAIPVLPVVAISPSGKPVDSNLPIPSIQCSLVIFRPVENPESTTSSTPFRPISQQICRFRCCNQTVAIAIILGVVPAPFLGKERHLCVEGPASAEAFAQKRHS